MGESWTLDDLKKWTRGLMSTHRVIAPVSGPSGYEWAEVTDPERIAWSYTKTRVSPREYLIPRHEVLFHYDLGPNPPVIEEPPIDARPTVLLLLRPCDVGGLRALDAVMRWDYQEEGFEARRGATFLVSLGCNEPADRESCFCESVGLDPRFAREADVALDPLADGKYRVLTLTGVGKALAKGAPRPVEAVPPAGPPEPKRIGTIPIDIERATAWMRSNFDAPLWQEISESCLGCGACAYLCPSCHCFDVVDEGDWRRGIRARNWDSCGFPVFTLHATGHNPRPRQWNRYRQRVYHKFVYYPDKFERLLCSGCGRCVDACPGGMDLIEVLQAVTEASTAGKEARK